MASTKVCQVANFKSEIANNILTPFKDIDVDIDRSLMSMDSGISEYIPVWEQDYNIDGMNELVSLVNALFERDMR